MAEDGNERCGFNLLVYLHNPATKAFVLVKRHRLRHVLVRLLCLLSTFPSHYLPLFVPAAVADRWGGRPK
jgi:hypothetical protein